MIRRIASSSLLALALPAPAGPDGAMIYADQCASCHAGTRLGGTGPALIPESLGRLSGTWSRLSPQHARVAYAAAYLAADALITAYGADGARNLLRNLETLPQVTADLDRRVREER